MNLKTDMNINLTTQNQPPSFGIKISPKLKASLEKQVTTYPNPRILEKNLSKKLEVISNWATPTSELTIVKNHYGNYAIGLKKVVNKFFSVLYPIEHLNGKNELTQFTRLTEKNILDTENTIDYLYKKFGLEIFKKHKV